MMSLLASRERFCLHADVSRADDKAAACADAASLQALVDLDALDVRHRLRPRVGVVVPVPPPMRREREARRLA